MSLHPKAFLLSSLAALLASSCVSSDDRGADSRPAAEPAPTTTREVAVARAVKAPEPVAPAPIEPKPSADASTSHASEPVAKAAPVETAADPEPTAPVAERSAATADGRYEASVLGQRVSVDGEDIPEIEIKRYLAHGLGGKQQDHAKFGLLLKQELERRKQAGEDVSKYVPTPQDVEHKLAKDKTDFALKYPTLDFETEVGRAFLSVDLYREYVDQSLLFDRLFIPDDPDQWPPLTTEVVLAEGGPGFVDDAKESYRVRKQRMIDDGLPELPPDDPIWMDFLRQIVLESLDKFAALEYAGERLPPDVLIRVDGTDVMVEDVFRKVEGLIQPDVLEDAKKFLAMQRLIEGDLRQKGVLLSRDEFEKQWEPEKSLQEIHSKWNMLALSVNGFPSMEAFIAHTRLTASFKRSIADALKDNAELTTLLGPCNAICGAAKVDVEVILASAYDDATVSWKPDGWAYAERRAKEIKAKLDGGADWGTTLEHDSEFWDPPMPEVGQKPQFGFRFKGRFGQQTRNQLLSYVDENEYRIYLDGFSLTDHIFFKQAPGTIDGPLKGRKGYYITNVKGTVPPVKPLDLNNPKHRELLEQYYVKEKFNQYARELYAQAIADKRVVGL